MEFAIYEKIEEENLFRRDLALMQGKKASYRFRKTGVLISEADDHKRRLEGSRFELGVN